MIKKLEKYRLCFVKTSLMLGFIFAMFGSLFFNLKLWEGMYYHLMQLGFVFYLFAFYLLSKKDSKGFNKLWKTITLIILLCSVSTIIDEIFYDATKVELNDLIRIAFIIFASFKINYKFTLWKTLLNL